MTTRTGFDEATLERLWFEAGRGGKSLNVARQRQFAANVRSLCRRRNLSLKDVNKTTGIDYRLLRRWASKGISKSDRRTGKQLETFASFFGIPAERLWDRRGDIGGYDEKSREFGDRAHRLYRAFNSRLPRKPSPSPYPYGSPSESTPPGSGDDHDRWQLFIQLAKYFDDKLRDDRKAEAESSGAVPQGVKDQSTRDDGDHIAEQPKKSTADTPVTRVPKTIRPVLRTDEERQARIDATTIIHGDCRDELPKLASSSVDAVIADPIYPEIDREYGRITEPDWHDLMKTVVKECRRILKPTGSAVFILQPNYESVGQMRLWLWEFMVWAAKEWNLIQDFYSWTQDAMPLTGTNRKQGLMRQSVKMCVWLGPKNCYRNQDAVLNTPSQRTADRSASDNRMIQGRNDKGYRIGTMAGAAAERGGTTPFNLMPISNGGQPRGDHPATTPHQLAEFWCKYLLPENGVLLDCFSGGGGILAAGLDHGASRVIGIEQEERYVEMAWERIRKG